MNETLALPALFSIAGLWFWVAWLYRDYRVDLFRERLFTLRDELFDLASAGKLSFDNPAYGILRTTTNGFIRFGDRVCVPWAVGLELVTKSTQDELRVVRAELDDRWAEGLRDLDKDTQWKLHLLRTRLHHEVAKQILFASPIVLSLSVALVVPIALVIFLKKQVRRLVLEPWQPGADAVAYSEGCLA